MPQAHDNTPAPQRRRGVYLLPNLFTTAALFAGFYAVIAAMSGRFGAAAAAIFVAMVMDGLDGRVARLTNTSSDFGKEYDSLSDMVSFGVAPALVMYQWGFQGLADYGWLWAKLGWIGAFYYTGCAALRLARFNTRVGVVDKRYFQGLPSPSGAAVLTGLVWFLVDFGIRPTDWISYVVWAVAVFAGVTMVSNVPFWSFKEVNWKKRVPLWVILACVIGISIVASRPSLVLWALFMSYALSGYVMWAMGHRVRPVLPEE